MYRNVLLYGINATLKADCKCLFDPVILFIIFIPSEQNRFTYRLRRYFLINMGQLDHRTIPVYEIAMWMFILERDTTL